MKKEKQRGGINMYFPLPVLRALRKRAERENIPYKSKREMAKRIIVDALVESGDLKISKVTIEKRKEAE